MSQYLIAFSHPLHFVQLVVAVEDTATPVDYVNGGVEKVSIFGVPQSVWVHIALIFERTNQLLLQNENEIKNVTSNIVGMASEGGGVTLYAGKGVRLSDIFG